MYILIIGMCTNWFSHAKKYWLLYLFFILLIFIIAATYKDYGIIWDEGFYLDLGKYYLNQFFRMINQTTNLDLRGLANYNYQIPELHLKGHGVFFDIGIAFVTLFIPRFSFETYHLIKALVSLSTFLLLAALIYKLFKKTNFALLSVILLLVFPRFYGEIFQNSIDTTTTLCVVLSIYYFIYFLESRQKLLHMIVLSFIFAIAINQRILLFYIYLLSMLTWFLIEVYKKKPLLKFISKAFAIFLMLIVFMHFTHPYLFTHPISGLYNVITTSAKFNFTASVLFDGNFIEANKLPWYYLPKTMLITIPPVTILLAFLGLIRLVYLFIIEKDVTKKFVYFYLLLIFFSPFIIVFILKPVLYNSWQHLLFLTIPTIISAIFGFEYIELISKRGIKIFFYFVFFISILMTANEMIILHPYQYLYYNFFIGGLKGAYGKHETDYAGAAYKEAIEWFNTNINDGKKTYYIKAEGDPLSTRYYLRKNTYLTDDLLRADYQISFTRWNLHTFYPGKIIHTIDREGVPLIFIKKVN